MTREEYRPTPLRAGAYIVARARRQAGWTVTRDGRPVAHHHDPQTGQKRPAMLHRAQDALRIAQDLDRAD